VILPLGFSIADSVGASVMLQVNALKDSSDDYAAEFIVSGTVGFDITDQIGGYVELFASKFDDIGEKTQATFDFGVTYSPEAELQFDAGANLGLNSNTEDMQLFVGVSRRW
ncbi:MAG: transporter, partial [Hyphomonadaceae bacterium]